MSSLIIHAPYKSSLDPCEDDCEDGYRGMDGSGEDGELQRRRADQSIMTMSVVSIVIEGAELKGDYGHSSCEDSRDGGMEKQRRCRPLRGFREFSLVIQFGDWVMNAVFIGFDETRASASDDSLVVDRSHREPSTQDVEKTVVAEDQAQVGALTEAVYLVQSGFAPGQLVSGESEQSASWEQGNGNGFFTMSASSSELEQEDQSHKVVTN
ncbi:hypothetical protein GG344DRAFT_65245 [Lentinula edodes]|nr:hypothetical protein GG344DRAFT_65245 [Lentinula edodes]